MSSKSVAEKLGIESGDRILLLDAPDGYRDTLGPLPNECEVVASHERDCDIVQLFVRDGAAFDDHIRSAIGSADTDSRLWITYPKKSSNVDSDLSRDVVAERMGELGWRGARQIAVDETWSALWFRPED